MSRFRLCSLAAACLLAGAQGNSPAACPLPLTAGRSARWPQTNPALVAPVTLVYDNSAYKQPLQAELLSDSISIPVPPDFLASFNLTSGQGASQEHYALRSLVLRKPGRVAEGASQVISHVLEMVLLYENVAGADGDWWSSVVVPFSVELGAPPDMLSALLAGSSLPAKYGERSPVLMGTAQVLNLNDVFINGTFLTYWSSLPTKCTDVSRPVRQFMRTASLVTSPAVFDVVLAALRSVPDAPPLPSADVAWLSVSCSRRDVTSGACAARQPLSLTEEIQQAKVVQSQAVAKIRTAKQAMDSALIALRNVTDQTYHDAVKAREMLQSASSELDGATEHVETLQAWEAQAASATWQTTPPSADDAASSATPSLIATAQLSSHGQQAGAGSSQGSCLALGRSPVAISPADVAKLQATWNAPRVPVAFGQGSFTTGAEAKSLQLYNTGEYLRVVVPAGAGSPLGSIQRAGKALDVVFADVHVPGEHSIDGHFAAAEVHLVHLPKGGGPAVAVALRLQEGGDGGAYDNPWVASLLSVVPPASSEAALPPLANGARGLHAALMRGDASRYFRYDGTLTRAPCRTAEWFVLEEPGTISSRQLAALRAALPQAAPLAAGRAALQPASLIAEGIQDFPAPSSIATVSLLGKWGLKQRSIHAL